ncbi:MAG: hypothetical protein ACRDD1_04375 [Planctomycetia bacterium]
MVVVVLSIQLAMTLYFAALTLRITSRRLDLARDLWTAGALFCVMHVVSALHFVHRWNHDALVAETARQTAVVVGWNWGGGVYVNYVFVGLWLLDAVWWRWCGHATYGRRRPRLHAALQFFLGFIVFNALIVFKTGLVRWEGTAGFLLLATTAVVARCGWLSRPVFQRSAGFE